MKKNFCKAIGMALCAFTACFAFFGCAPSGPQEGVLQVIVQNAGYGYKWLTDVAQDYEALTGIKVDITNQNAYGKTSEKAMNYVNNYTDLYFDITNPGYLFSNQYKGASVTDGSSDRFFVDLSDVFDSPAEGYGEGVTIEDIVSDYSLRDVTYTDGKQYAFSWARAIDGMIYNKQYFDDNNLKLPRTTQELFKLCDDIKDLKLTNHNQKTVYPIIWTKDYWEQCTMMWTFQYEGLDVYRNYLEGKDASGKYSAEIYRMQGKYYAYYTIEELISTSKGYADIACAGRSFTQNQVKFLEGEAFMMPNGDWLEREMKANFEDDALDIAFMKVPVVSQLTEKLDTIKSDSALSEVIAYIDGDITEEELTGDYSPEDIERVREARSITYTQQATHIGYIPFYAPHIEEAKDFIVYLHGKDVQMKIAESSFGNMFPIDYDFSGEEGYEAFSNLKMTADDILQGAELIGPEMIYPLYYIGGLQHRMRGQEAMGLSGGSAKTALQIIQEQYSSYEPEFAEYMIRAGVSN